MPSRNEDRVETVEFNGVVYRRYPDSDNITDSRYFRCGSSDVARGFSTLHRAIWIHCKGRIPTGHHVHHKDGNPSNNDIENLECLTHKEHMGKHPYTEERRRNVKKLMDEIRPLATEWHGSEEGKEWHSQQARRTWVYRQVSTFVCAYCGKDYQTKSIAGNERFCSNNCRSYSRRDSGIDNEQRTCEWCGKAFTVNKYKRNRFCSRSHAALNRCSKRDKK